MRKFNLVLMLFCFTPVFAQTVSSKPHLGVNASTMDTSVDPCTDFFAYSCGSWIKNNPIPPDESGWGISYKLQDDNKQILRQILESASAPDPARDATMQKIGDYYAACMDESSIEATGDMPFQGALERIAALRSQRDLAGLIAETPALYTDAGLGRSALFHFSSEQDAADSSQIIAVADQGGLGLPDRDFYLNTDAKSAELRRAYLAHVQRMFELLGDKGEVAATEAQTVMRIETALAQGSLTQVQRRDPRTVYHKMTRQQLEALAPAFHWNEYLAKIGLPREGSLDVSAPGFFKTLNAQLEKEDLPNWKTYLRWRLVNINAPYLSSPFVNADFDFYGKTLEGAKEIQPRWKRCVANVDQDLGEALGRAYVQKNFSPEAKQRVLKMVAQIEEAMQRDIESLSWMTPATKTKAQEKLHAVANKIGYPDKWRDYSALTIDRHDQLGNVLRARAFEFHRQLGKIGKPLDRGEWEMTPPTVNAYYSPQMNDINFPAGILQPPLFNPNADDAPNYGDTGGTIGHELTHGFDDEGRQFDAHGNLRDWWTAADAKEFDQRASCISDQYSQYVIIDDIKINGKLTLGEDVADLGGLMLAHMAWQDKTKEKKLEPIDGFTPEQRFFIAFGQGWCSSRRDEEMRLRATVDPHSPPKFRVNGVVSNMPEFQQAFQCKSGAAMVRQNRCRVW
jgi:endothelin-converting enzyme/putative endopeptidase